MLLRCILSDFSKILHFKVVYVKLATRGELKNLLSQKKEPFHLETLMFSLENGVGRVKRKWFVVSFITATGECTCPLPLEARHLCLNPIFLKLIYSPKAEQKRRDSRCLESIVKFGISDQI